MNCSVAAAACAEAKQHVGCVVVEQRCDPVLSGKIGDLLAFEDTAAFRQVRMDYGYRPLLEQILESSGEVDVLAGVNRRPDGVLDPNEVVGVLPGYGPPPRPN